MKTHLEDTVEEILHTHSVSKAQKLMESQSGIWLVGLVSFIEAALPIPILTDPFMIAAIMMNRSKTALIILVTTITSVLGGIFAFISVIFFLDFIERFVSSTATDPIVSITEKYGDGTLLISILGAIAPLPYTSASWAVALIGGNLLVFAIASLFGRGLRYLTIGYLTYRYGPTAVRYGRRTIIVASVAVCIVVALYLWHKM
jgi:membrane protein YqaA with SNARE-associated domain